MQTETTSESTQRTAGNSDDALYEGMLTSLNSRFNALLDGGKQPLFTTDARGLWAAYLDAFPRDERQYHNCNSCRRFIERFGGLVAITAEGLLVPAMWESLSAPPLYAPVVDVLRQLVTRARVTGLFLSPLPMWGEPRTGVWRHFAVCPPVSARFMHATQTAYQAIAEKTADFQQVSRALGEFPLPLLACAVSLLEGDDLRRSEKVLGPAKFLYGLQTTIDGLKGPRRANLIWRRVATAPAGFCHPRSSMLGTLLDDLAAGKDYNEVARSFGSKMLPDHYQRPVAAPSEGAIEQAERLVAKLGAAGALERRFARLDEVDAIWRAKPVDQPKGEGVFGHLKVKDGNALGEMIVPPQAITWAKFARDVLPNAQSIEAMVPSIGNFCAILTAANPDAAPILQWDSLEKRNPFSWYFHMEGSRAHQWGLTGNAWVEVPAVTLKPSSWFGGALEHHGEGAVLILAGALDSVSDGNALFPETLRSEFHGVRAVIEAYSKEALIGGRAEAGASGIGICKGGFCQAHMRVRTGDGITRQYKIDRWE
jgi:hypothetical protein